MTVIREDRVVEIAAERGLRGKDGTSSQIVLIEQTNSSGSAIVATTANGAPADADDLFMMRLENAFTSGTLTLDITPVTNGDPRAVKLPGSDAGVPAGSLAVGSWIIVGIRDDAFFELISPSVSTGASGAIVLMEQTDRTGNIITFQPAEGQALPNNTGIGVLMGGFISGAPAATVLAFAIEGITLDPQPLDYLDGTTVPVDRLSDGDFAIWTRNETTGFYDLLAVWDADHAKGAAAANTRTDFYASANSRIYAQSAFGK